MSVMEKIKMYSFKSNHMSKVSNLFSVKVFFLSLFLSAGFSACVDQDFDQPPAGGFDPNIPVTTTIAALKALHTLGQYEQITDDLTFAGLVVSNDAAGNFFKQLVIQDETGGIEMRIEMTDMNNVYPVGRKVYVKAKNLWLGDYNGLIQLGVGVDQNEDELIRIPESLVDQFIIPATYGNTVTPKSVSIDQLTLNDVSTLITLSGVQFTGADAGETYADAVLQQSLNREIQDCAQNILVVRSSGFASFAGEPTPEGNGTITGVLGIFGSTYQLVIRDLNDVNMTGDRCASNVFTIAQIRNLFSGGPTTVPAGSIRGVVTSDYTSQSVTGRNLYMQDATAGIVVRFDANHPFTLGDEITLDVSGANLSEFNGLLQLDGLSTGAGFVEGHPGDVTPRNATVLEVLNNAQAWESTLVRIENVTLSGTTFNGEVMVTDATGTMIMFTRSQATFSSNPLPTGEVDITALITEFNAPQLLIRNASDVSGGGTGTTDLDESFDSVADNQDINLPGWVNVAVKGTRKWRARVFEGNHYAQATAFNDTNAEMETWLITPSISLEEAKKISFETAHQVRVHDGFSVLISNNFDGVDIAAATWMTLDANLVPQSTPDHDWVPSGDVSLAGFTGPVRVAFKYVGSGPGGQTTSFRVDNVKVSKL